MHNAFLEQIRRFYETHRQELFTYALALTGRRESAEDVVHTAFHNVLRRGSAPRELRPYVFRCIRNAAVDELRRAERQGHQDSLFAKRNGKTEPAYAGAHGAAHGAAPGTAQSSENDVAHDAEFLSVIEESLAALNADERESIVLKLYDGLTFNEIAAVRRVSINTASSWYRRGIEKLRTLLHERMNDEGH